VFEAAKAEGLRFTMIDPWTTLLLDDERMIHESTPLQPAGSALGHRDTLVVTYRAGGFQGPPDAGSAAVPPADDSSGSPVGSKR
jgi:hypothetical protein